jgi:hypothetical protein
MCKQFSEVAAGTRKDILQANSPDGRGMFLGQDLADRATESADNIMVFGCHDPCRLASCPDDFLAIDRFDRVAIKDSGFDALFG